MATISNQALRVENLNATTVRVTVNYVLNPSPEERRLGTVFRENIQLVGDDAGTVNDFAISNFPEDLITVNRTSLTVSRTRIRNVLKSAMNEDPAFLANGGERNDEAFARITLTYVGNDPTPSQIPPPSSTSAVTSYWK